MNAEQARAALDKLLREEKEPSWLELALQELWVIFVKEGRAYVTSKNLVARLTADPTSPWCEYDRGRRLTQRGVSILFGKLHIRPRLVGKARLGGYCASDFFEKEIFEHFLGRQPLILSPKKQNSRPDRKKKRSGR